MKRRKWQRAEAILLSAGMAVTALSGCGSEAEESASVGQVLEDLEDSENHSERGVITRGTEGAAPTGNSGSDAGSGASEAESGDAGQGDKEQVILENSAYVMIYNPYFYDEYSAREAVKDPADLFSGDFSSQISTGTVRAGSLDAEMPEVSSVSQWEQGKDLDLGEFQLESSRAGGLDPVYSEGDTHEFYCGLDQYTKETFTCLYEGENCYIWGLGDAISEEEAKSYGEEFDAAVYPVDTAAFGQARFTENGGKINLLFYSFNCTGNTMTLGYFRPYDLFSTEEAGAYVDVYQMNTDHAIVHINSQAKEYDDELVYSTMGHEFQHLICFSDVFAAGGSATVMRTWLNESMSAYAEDLLYPGSKDKNNYNIMFYASEVFRKGQSLYNFDVSQDENLGAYGIVYLFSEYLSDLSGEDIFSKIHSFWRENPAAVTEAQAIAATVPEDVYSEIDKNYIYSSSVESSFTDEYEAWMSKLTLDFYLNTFQTDMANLGDYEEKCFELMQYNEVNPLDVEGGGRVFVQTKDNQYTVPTDADDNLIYIGLDENFNIVDTYGVNE